MKQPTTIDLKVRRVTPGATLPTYATDGSACFDLHYTGDGRPVDIHPGESEIFCTGLSFEIPPGWSMLIFSRSGHGFKNDIRLANCVGVIDSDYRGEVLVKLISDQDVDTLIDAETATTLRVNPGDRIAQALLVPTYRVGFEEVSGLSHTKRGTGGFGSTGA